MKAFTILGAAAALYAAPALAGEDIFNPGGAATTHYTTVTFSGIPGETPSGIPSTREPITCVPKALREYVKAHPSALPQKDVKQIEQLPLCSEFDIHHSGHTTTTDIGGWPPKPTTTEVGNRPHTTSTEHGHPHHTTSTEHGHPHHTTSTEEGRPHTTSTTINDGRPHHTTSTDEGRPHTTSTGLPHQFTTNTATEIRHTQTHTSTSSNAPQQTWGSGPNEGPNPNSTSSSAPPAATNFERLHARQVKPFQA